MRPTASRRSLRPWLPVLALSAFGLGGCAAFGPLPDATPVEARRDLPLFDGADGMPITWDDLLDRIAGADVVVIGEQHDDVVGHGFQRAVFEAVVERWPGSALSMEMLDRREQTIVEDYLADLIDRDTFIEATAATRWRRITRQYLAGEIDARTFQSRITRMGWPEWDRSYQPIVDVAKTAGATVMAANAPWATYTKWIDAGYDRLDDLTPAQRALIDVPPEVPADGRYRERFWEVMADRAEGEPPKEAEEEETDGEAAHRLVTDEQVLEAFRSQLLYDATMAASIMDAMRDGAVKVVHLVGQFHSDFEGGTVLFTRQMDPALTVLVISMQPEGDGTALREDDEERADVVVYTGAVSSGMN